MGIVRPLGDQPPLPSEDPHVRSLSLGAMELWRMHCTYTGWLLGASALVAAALEYGGPACALESASKVALACMFVAYAAISGLIRPRCLMRGTGAFAAMCALLAWGDALRHVSPNTIGSALARTLAFAVGVEAICAPSGINGMGEDGLAKKARTVCIGEFALHAALLLVVHNGRSIVHAILGVADVACLCVLTLAQWRNGRVGRKKRIWPMACSGLLLVTLGRVFEGMGDAENFGAVAARSMGLVYLAAQYAALCSAELRGTGIFEVVISPDDP